VEDKNEKVQAEITEPQPVVATKPDKWESSRESNLMQALVSRRQTRFETEKKQENKTESPRTSNPQDDFLEIFSSQDENGKKELLSVLVKIYPSQVLTLKEVLREVDEAHAKEKQHDESAQLIGLLLKNHQDMEQRIEELERRLVGNRSAAPELKKRILHCATDVQQGLGNATEHKETEKAESEGIIEGPITENREVKAESNGTSEGHPNRDGDQNENTEHKPDQGPRQKAATQGEGDQQGESFCDAGAPLTTEEAAERRRKLYYMP